MLFFVVSKYCTSCKKNVHGARKVEYLAKMSDNDNNNNIKEADSACMFLGYQPKMPKKIHELKEKK